nr:uncharacterized protein LOC120968004 [Aegilops tauschii subsp. strangulata]
MVCEALNDTRRLAIHHPALLAPILEKVVLGILKTVKNPCSAVLKTSMMACTDVFLSSSCSSSLSKPMRAMATSMPPLPLLRKLQTMNKQKDSSTLVMNYPFVLIMHKYAASVHEYSWIMEGSSALLMIEWRVHCSFLHLHAWLQNV